MENKFQATLYIRHYFLDSCNRPDSSEQIQVLESDTLLNIYEKIARIKINEEGDATTRKNWPFDLKVVVDVENIVKVSKEFYYDEENLKLTNTWQQHLAQLEAKADKNIYG